MFLLTGKSCETYKIFVILPGQVHISIPESYRNGK